MVPRYHSGSNPSRCTPLIQKTAMLLVVQTALYLGYGLGHDILKVFVNNQDDLDTEDIKKGVNGFLSLMMLCSCTAVLLVLVSFPNKPTGNQLPEHARKIELERAANEEKVQFGSLIENQEKLQTHIEESEAKLQDSHEAETDKTEEKKLGFCSQLKLLMTDPVYLFLVFGVLMASNTIGGQNVSMAVMLKTFGIPEVVAAHQSSTLELANSGTMGGLLGIFGYFILSKYSKKSVEHLVWILLCL
jgi:Organic Anion Transporter Polypeptide (OATP) family